MAEKKWDKSPQDLVDRFYQVMTAFPDAELRKMFGYPCAFLNGNMFVGLHETNMAVRLSSDDREDALARKEGKIFAPMNGRVMKEYVALSDKVIQDPQKLTEFVGRSFEYVCTLPIKVKK